MGHKRKQDRHRQVVPTGTASPLPVCQPRKHMIPSSRRNPVTGEPLTRNTPYIVVRNYAKLRHVMRHGNPDTLLDCIPLEIHHLRGDTIENKCTMDGLGAPEWTKQFRRYIRESERLRPQEEIAREYQWNHWYTIEWAEPELRAHFSTDLVDAVLAVKRDGADERAIARGLHHSKYWLGIQIAMMARHIRSILAELAAAS